MIKSYRVFADYHQFYLWDSGVGPKAPIDYTEADTLRRIKAAPFVVVIQPERNTIVPVEIEIAECAPLLVAADWDHVAEASLELPSGLLEFMNARGLRSTLSRSPLAPIG